MRELIKAYSLITQNRAAGVLSTQQDLQRRCPSPPFSPLSFSDAQRIHTHTHTPPPQDHSSPCASDNTAVPFTTLGLH